MARPPETAADANTERARAINPGRALVPLLAPGVAAGVEMPPLPPPGVEAAGEGEGEAVGEVEGAAEEADLEILMSTFWPPLQCPGMPQMK